MLPAVGPEPFHQSKSFWPLTNRRLGSTGDEKVYVPDAGASIQPVVTAANGWPGGVGAFRVTFPLVPGGSTNEKPCRAAVRLCQSHAAATSRASGRARAWSA